jgi:peptidoglycan/xylan/chitin deacetylase (PgdA/CDA1 family)
MVTLSDPTPHGIMFHHFHGGKHSAGQGSISEEDLSRTIDFLGPSRFLPAQDWFNHAVQGTLEPHHLCLTFDDGLLCQYDIAKRVMDDYSFTGFWFVYSSAFRGGAARLEIYRHFRNTFFDDIDSFYELFFATVEDKYKRLFKEGHRKFDPTTYLSHYNFYSRNDKLFRYFRDVTLKNDKYHEIMESIISEFDQDLASMGSSLWLTDDHLRDLDAQGHCIGLHSFSHPTRMEDLSKDSQLSEYTRNFDHLARLLGKKPQAMSHPCNSYSFETLKILNSLGISLGVRAKMIPDFPASMLEWPREDHANIMSQLRQADED